MRETKENTENILKNIQQSHQKTLKAVLFDMDNTLFDFVAVKLIACREILSYLGEKDKNFMKDPEELFRYFLRGTYGFEDYENIRDYMQERNLYTVKAYRYCCEIYDREKLQNLKLYPGVRDTLEELKKLGLKLAIITDADKYHAQARLMRVGLLDSFEFLVSADMTGTKKPDPAHFLFALDSLGIKPEESLVVGDSIKRDMAPARKLGFKTAYASYGDWRQTDEKEQCFDFQLNTFQDLIGFIDVLNQGKYAEPWDLQMDL
ncbi:Hydrolase, HAD superfamily [Methanosarcina horonobensis HB-1 = JCM 15518]|uniref:Hydrolase, HAD superfamily n=2 Tax=Methanosarcina horonobensis TaxID=418008 RepID=A0A0E3WUV9_9EURY|nr:HAD family hydrolase [Methanosarcina horonobensis]AKB79455.1 Hydrolase, HAD superfamily [Methanosarcina horonobensis HB-1 = JCM 15518]